MRRASIVAAVALLGAAAVAGCQTVSRVGESIGLSGEREETYLAELRTSADDAPCGGDAATAVRLADVDYGLGRIRERGLDAYVNGVLGKLIAASPRPDCRVRAMVIPNNDLTTVATADGGILLPLGLMRELKTEDELAAILGHEFSHVLLRHHESDSFLSTQDELLKGVDAAYAAHAMFSGITGKGGDLGDTRVIANAVYEVSESVIAPAWTREQEDEADLLGADLAAAAGYNPTAMGRIMGLLQAHEKQMAERARLREKMQGEKFRNAVYGSFSRAGTTGENPLADPGLLVALGGMAAETMSAMFSGDSHRPAAERKEQVSDYVRAFHRENRRRAFAEDAFAKATSTGQTRLVLDHLKVAAEARRLVAAGDIKSAETLARRSVSGGTGYQGYARLAFYEVRKKQGRDGKAAQNLDIALRSGEAPWTIYLKRATLYQESGDLGGAVRTVESANRKFGQPVAILPFAISTYKANGQPDRVRTLLDRCRVEGTRTFFESCRAAAGLKDDGDKTGEGGLGGAFESLIGR